MCKKRIMSIGGVEIPEVDIGFDMIGSRVSLELKKFDLGLEASEKETARRVAGFGRVRLQFKEDYGYQLPMFANRSEWENKQLQRIRREISHN